MICLSFDTDHMSDERMREFLDRVNIPGKATFFCTQLYQALAGSTHELGPHVYLESGRDWTAELDAKRSEFPSARGWRSHSCVFSHIIAEQLARRHYQYVSLHDELGRAGIRPLRHAWGIWHLPIYYMDNLDFSAQRFWQDAPEPFSPRLVQNAVTTDGLYVFAFHPIHLLLNSPSAEEYFLRRPAFERGDPIDELAFDGYGALDFYRDLCVTMHSHEITSVSMSAALDSHLATGARGG